MPDFSFRYWLEVRSPLTTPIWHGYWRFNSGRCGGLEKELGVVARGLRHFVYRIAFLFHE